ncbi:MAG: hypothetical protein EOP83_11575 [Verrucomicrobiaceae bacterium]|nr:MAG: hypothetical protein EOP83_11575 [Verrucomicrobiaceae bacterium]
MSNKRTPRGGIVQPNTKHSFRVKFCGGYIDTTDSYLDFMQNMHSVEIDLVAKRVTLVVRDDVLSLVSQHIAKMLNLGETQITVEHLLGSCDPISVKDFVGCKALSHSCGFDYGDAGVAMHTLVFSYYRFYAHPVRKPEPEPTWDAKTFDPTI